MVILLVRGVTSNNKEAGRKVGGGVGKVSPDSTV